MRRKLLDDGSFGGGWDVVEEDIAPADVVMEELRRTLAFVRFIEKHMGNWGADLVDLSERNYDDKGSMQVTPTEEAAWLALYNTERQHLVRVAKTASDMGIEERAITLAENQANMIFDILEAAFEALQLTDDQRGLLPTIMPDVINRIAIPGEVVHRSTDVLG